MNPTKTDMPTGLNHPISQIRGTLEKATRIMVVSHIDPDGDALGTQLAFGSYLKSLGKEVHLVRDSGIPDKYRFLPGVDKIVQANSLPKDISFDTGLVLECPSLKRAGSAAGFLANGLQIVNIDHHQDSAEYGTVNWIDTKASSVGEMAYEYFQATDFDIDSDVATCLYTAILTDTGRFRYASTTSRTMTIAGNLIAHGADPRVICDFVYYDMKAPTMILTGRVLNSIEYHHDGRVCILTLTADMLAESGADESDSDGLVDFTLFTKGVTTGALLKEIDADTTKVSLRSCNGVNVAEIAAKFGGGGHFNAAGCRVPLSLDKAKQEILKLLRDANGQSN
ncbi:MAG: bifunctional oligoribonuclease/PAP phosphatase NrnA [bacterium]|nr:bifunctional oligoribonuclease/PAP phosphatase NrnA [bacterium]